MFVIIATLTLITSLFVLSSMIFCCQAYLKKILEETQSDIFATENFIEHKQTEINKKHLDSSDKKQRHISTQTHTSIENLDSLDLQ